MDKIAKELVRMAKELISADADLEAIAEVVKNNKFLSLRNPLKKMGLKKVDFSHAGFPHWSMKTRRGKTVAIVNKKHADPSSGDVVVGDFVVGYL